MTHAHENQHEFLGIPAVISAPSMVRFYSLVERVAGANASVLISGESGSGKELVARAIHHYSPRSHKPWIDLSCASLPEHLMESELFGYDKGAFSGALVSKPGLFELAHEGTIFLDEIGELDPRMQTKLLRVLDGAPYYRLGATRKTQVNVRVVAATNRDLACEVRAGRFRADLYHRLSQLELRVPPLRERREEILPLAEFFLAQQSRDLFFRRDAADALLAYDWPGNLRELRNVVTRAAVFAAGAAIERADLQLPVAVSSLTAASHAVSSSPVSLDDLERNQILEVLKRTGGHQQRAADLLGISRRTLSRKLKAYESASYSEA